MTTALSPAGRPGSCGFCKGGCGGQRRPVWAGGLVTPVSRQRCWSPGSWPDGGGGAQRHRGSIIAAWAPSCACVSFSAAACPCPVPSPSAEAGAGLLPLPPPRALRTRSLKRPARLPAPSLREPL
uniref:Uncharacterized protein n=1 Tax=Pipistrellus kuhlii TaxID=59472 RepID=A0A7J7R4N5_PIPKU|nr:hypothetical protein mPipKuh1_010844 [Pipistrellus kuhlii]